MSFRSVLIAALLIIAGGCTQIAPHYLTASAYEKSLILYNEGRLTEAREKILKIGKEEADYQAAQELLLKIDQLAARLAKKHRELGEEYEKANLYSAAANEYRIALQFEPANQSAIKRLEAVEAKRIYIRKKETKPESPETTETLAKEHYKKGVVLLKSKQFIKAIEEFDIVIKLVVSYKDTDKLIAAAKKERDGAIDTHLKKGMDYFQKEELESAIKEWDMALEIDPLNKTATDYKARAEAILEKMKDIAERNK